MKRRKSAGLLDEWEGLAGDGGEGNTTSRRADTVWAVYHWCYDDDSGMG